jgi:hypothetical protein
MLRYFAFPVVFLASVLGLACSSPATLEEPKQVYRVVQQDESFQIRLVALKHSHISMADGDANLAMQAVKSAAAKGLAIRDVGNHNINRDGGVQLVMWTENDLDKLQAYVSQMMKIDAQPGDTFIIFTIGHGLPDGTIQNMGQRAGVMKAFAAAAEENQQRTLWWQLSCYASAGLPPISSLPSGQQELFSVMASSTANQQSPAYVEGRVMEKLFVALAGKDKTLDDGSGQVTAGRMRNFLNRDGSRRGELLYSISPDTPIFGGGMGLANSLSIVDRNGRQGQYPRGYIPLPKKR